MTFLFLKNFSHISCAYISETKIFFNVKSSTYYFPKKTNISVDFHICISVPLILLPVKTLGRIKRGKKYGAFFKRNLFITQKVIAQK